MVELPIHQTLEAICLSVKAHDVTIIQAPPGAGKTTQVPLSLLDLDELKPGKILLLQPRRIAAQQACYRLAEQISQAPGQLIGYTVRLEQKTSTKTRLEVITEGVLLRYLQNDPSLSNISAIIFDECHERSLNADLALSLSLQAREIFDCRCKLVFMSASLDTSALENLFPAANCITSQGRSYPVDVHYQKKSLGIKEVISTCLQLLIELIEAQTPGDILVFLPGQKEIHSIQQQLKQHSQQSRQVILPLYSQLPLEQQSQALKADPNGRQKIILATNIAETSLTIDGIRTVVDSGLCRQAKYLSKTAMTQLTTRRISQAQALQRTGRAGRLAAGTCYRLWSKEQEAQLEQTIRAEIHHADLSDLCLQLYQWGSPDTESLQWLDAPPDFAYQQAKRVLTQTGAVKNKTITNKGQAMARLPCHPRISALLLHADALDRTQEGCALAALLEYPGKGNSRLDLIEQLKQLTPQQKKLARNFEQVLKKSCTKSLKLFTEQQITLFRQQNLNTQLGILIALSYPDKIAQQQSNGNFKLSSGRQAQVHHAKLKQAHYIACIDSISFADQANDTIYSGSPLDIELLTVFLPSALQKLNLIHWPLTASQCYCKQQIKLGELLLEEKELKPDEHPQQCQEACMDYIRAAGLQCFNDYAEFNQRLNRLNTVAQHLELHLLGQHDEWTEAVFLKQLEVFLKPYLQGIYQLKKLKKVSLCQAFLDQLDWSKQQALDTLAPKTLLIPSGRMVAIDYSQSPPKLSVKLQEMFGCQQTPSIAAGKIPLQIELLSPAQRPLQITQDLNHFWDNSYHDIKKEMKGRYPKHPWPDDPLHFIASAKTKKHL